MTDRKLNLTMLCDYYELTMGNGYFDHGMGDKITYFDVFYRQNPDNGGFAIAAGLEQVVEYIQNLHFDDEDIEYLRGRKMFSEQFLEYLRNFKFEGDIWAVPEGTPVFPREPLMIVRAPAIQAQLIETYVLLEINHQSLIATKANRVCRAAEGRVVLEFGSRRAQGIDGAVTGARAAYIGGCAGTAWRPFRHALRRSGRRHDGTLLGADVRLGVRGLQGLLRDLSDQRDAARRHLQLAQKRRSQRHPRVQ